MAVKSIFSLLIAAVLTGSAASQDLVIRAYLDRTTAGVNQQFTLNVELSGKDAAGAKSPQLPNMDEFAAFLGSGTSQNYQVINGKMTSSKIISYYFQAVKEGTFTIGAVTVESGGKSFRTDPLTITIQKSASQAKPAPGAGAAADDTGGPAADELFVRVLASPRKVYQNEPVVVTYTIFTLVNVSQFGFTKLPGTAGFWSEEYDLGQPQASSEVLNGRRYTVAVIKKMALFPMSPGVKTIEPLEIACDVRVRQRSRDMFDDFFGDSFFGRTVRKTITSNPVTIEVVPLPEEGKPPGFSGVVGSYTIKDYLDKTDVRTNEALTYRLTIEGKGNIQTLQAPDIVFPSDFEAYPPKVTQDVQRGQGITGKKMFEYVLIPRAAGTQRMKPVLFSFFNPETRAYQTLRTNEKIITVAKGEDVLAVIPGGLSKKEVNLLGADIRFIKTESAPLARAGRAMYASALFWTLAALPLAALLSAFLYRRRQDRMLGDVAYARDRRAAAVSKKRLSVARSHLDTERQVEFFADVGKALTGYLADKMNFAEAGMVSEEVKRDLQKRGISEAAVNAYFDCLDTCDRIRFSPSEANLDGMKEFLKRAEKAMISMDKELSK